MKSRRPQWPMNVDNPIEWLTPPDQVIHWLVHPIEAQPKPPRSPSASSDMSRQADAARFHEEGGE